MNKNNFRRLGTMIDCSRNAVMKVETVKKWIDITSAMGYNTIMIYTEDTYEVDNQPYFGYMRGRYSKEEMREMDKYAASKGMELIPCIQTLAHLNAIYRWPQYEEIKDLDQILIVGDERTYKFIDDMFATLETTVTTKYINVGMDETYRLGRGRYLDANGYETGVDILVKHLTRVAEIAAKHGFELLMWGDMFFSLLNEGKHDVDEIRKRIPSNVNIIYWEYSCTDKNTYIEKIGDYRKLKDEPWYAGGVFTWYGFAPHNANSMDAISASMAACGETKVKDVIFTLWGDNGAECSKFSALPALYYASELAHGNTDINAIKAGFKDMFGMDFDTFMLLDLPETPNDTKEKNCDAEKYMLYNDCFTGLFDTTIDDNAAEGFEKCAQKLAKVNKDTEYGYLFDSMQKLCEVLAVKADFGKRLRKAYTAGDKEALKNFIPEFEKMISLVNEFYYAFRKQWMQENKPHGFDVQDIRFGALLLRLRSCSERLQDYIDGKIAVIEELEEKQLDPLGRGENYPSEPLEYNTWGRIVTANLNYGD